MINIDDRKCKINPLIYGIETTLATNLKEKLYRLVNEFGRTYRKRKLRINNNNNNNNKLMIIIIIMFDNRRISIALIGIDI